MHYSASILGGVSWVDQPPEAPNTQGVVLVGGVGELDYTMCNQQWERGRPKEKEP